MRNDKIEQARKSWSESLDKDVFQAVENLDNYDPEIRHIILEEAERRKKDLPIKEKQLEEDEINNESVSLEVGDDAVQICPNCLEPCDPLDKYCQNCDSNDPVNPIASYMPLESIRFSTGVIGKLLRKIWD